MIDFSDCRIVPGRAYNGANGSKIAVEYQNKVYMLKFPPSGRDKPTALSYTNGCVSEHLASSIFNMLGVNAQETMLGSYLVNGKKKLVCACKDFTIGGKRLFDFCSIKNTILDSDSNGSGTELSEILDAMEKQSFVSSAALIEHFWNMFVIDALLGNFDRHNGNWGFLYDEITGETTIAPVFDCGSCLLPQADEITMKKVLTVESELHARVFQFPTSAIKLNNRKINYYDFMMHLDSEDCKKALKKIVPRIQLDEINAFVDQTEPLTELQKEFYKTYIKARYELILLPAFELMQQVR